MLCSSCSSLGLSQHSPTDQWRRRHMGGHLLLLLSLLLLLEMASQRSGQIAYECIKKIQTKEGDMDLGMADTCQHVAHMFMSDDFNHFNNLSPSNSNFKKL
ncbi:hypothetical protein NMG60_11007555 [Bertholletia excelsa]